MDIEIILVCYLILIRLIIKLFKIDNDAFFTGWLRLWLALKKCNLNIKGCLGRMIFSCIYFPSCLASRPL